MDIHLFRLHLFKILFFPIEFYLCTFVENLLILYEGFCFWIPFCFISFSMCQYHSLDY